ncbi:MAG: hypothetical protein HY360_17955 [Verrucomicrobia bacterium]|nr:hypothetical protein [Verrucomicrobiota bacterium]
MRARADCFGVPHLSMAAFYRLDGLLFQFGTQQGRRDAFEVLQRLRRRFARLRLGRPHARRLLATMDFVIAYERIKRLMDSRGRLAAQQALLRQAGSENLRPDPRLVASYKKNVAEADRFWKIVFKAHAARLDTRSDLGNLAIINVKAYHAWKKFRGWKA